MSPRPALAVCLYVEGKHCLVLGEGPVADERAARLAAAGARVARPGSVDEGTFDGVFLVFCCDAADPGEVSRAARAAGALVYVHDRPDLSDLAMPALARRGPLQIAVSTDGRAPALARRLREELDRLLATGGPALDALVADLSHLRDELPPGGSRDRLVEAARALSIDGQIVFKS